jgi:hypothetical protein
MPLECSFLCTRCHRQWRDESIIPIQFCRCGRITYGTAEREHNGPCECCKKTETLYKKNKGYGHELVCGTCLFGVEQ